MPLKSGSKRATLLSFRWIRSLRNSRARWHLRCDVATYRGAKPQRRLKEFEIFARGGLRLIAVTRQAFRSAADFSSDTTSGLRPAVPLLLAVALEAGISSLVSADRNQVQNAEAKASPPFGYENIKIGRYATI